MFDDCKPWERQRDDGGELEPIMWFVRFESYRLVGPGRTLLGAYNAWLQQAQPGTKRRIIVPGAWYRNAKKWKWKERAEAWDLSEHARLIAEDEAECRAMLKRHIQGAQFWQVRALKWLEATPVIEDGPLALRAWKEGITEERKARGMPEWILQLLTMDDDELRKRYRHLAGDGSDREDTGDAGGDGPEGGAEGETDAEG